MAGDWIKIEHVTPDKPEVHRIAALLGIDPDAVLGKLVRLWIWADQQTITGCAASVTSAQLERITNTPGFAKAMKTVGWLRSPNGEKGVTEFPNFDRHNGKTAKNRGLSAKRMLRSRCAASVTSAQPEKRGEKRREEKRREEGEGSAPADKPVENFSEEKPPSDLVQRWYFFNRGGRAVGVEEIAAMFEELKRHGISDAEISAELENPERVRGEWPSSFRQRMINNFKKRQAITTPIESPLTRRLREIQAQEVKNA